MILPVAAFVEMAILKISMAVLKHLVSQSPGGLVGIITLLCICVAVGLVIGHLNWDLVALVSDVFNFQQMPEFHKRIDTLTRNKVGDRIMLLL